MTSNVTQLRPRKPNRRPGALPATSARDLANTDGPALRVLLEQGLARRAAARGLPEAPRPA